ncbi:MAG TPA: threonine synthase, partial [Acidobacteriota bacterium]|nr:threonine synthase [Acidobacteriota bacterium]
KSKSVTASLKEAVVSGLASDGGLFLPVSIPRVSQDFLTGLRGKSFREIAFRLAHHLLSEDLSESGVHEIVDAAFPFDAPLVALSKQIHALELFHGPTLSFKDFGASFMARLIAYLDRAADRELVVLVATSGDTGSAVAHGFSNVQGTRVVLLYPSGKVSEIQEKQLTTGSDNIAALEVHGNFDDCQTLVKQAFVDNELQAHLRLTSANSINIARLIPQSFYYFHAWSQMETKNEVLISVPSGNYGNLTAGLLAKQMGLPVTKFIAASNSNDVVPEYMRSGIFRPRPSIKTLSNAMDVGNPSNFARILSLYESRENLSKVLAAASYSDERTISAIREIYHDFHYIADPHGAVGYLGLKEALQEHPSAAGIFLETAHPAKFPDIIKNALGVELPLPDEIQKCLAKTKRSIAMPNDFEEFKAYLLSL